MSVWGEENWILVSMWESCIMELFGYEQVADCEYPLDRKEILTWR